MHQDQPQPEQLLAIVGAPRSHLGGLPVDPAAVAAANLLAAFCPPVKRMRLGPPREEDVRALTAAEEKRARRRERNARLSRARDS